MRGRALGTILVVAAACAADPAPPPSDAGIAAPDAASTSPDGSGPFLDAGPLSFPDAAETQDAGSTPACAPALAITASSSATRPLGLISLVGHGGTGAYVFELESNASGAIVNALTGAYLAGPTAGTSDRVRLRDEGCEGEARIELRVVRPLVIRPRAATVRPGTRLQLAVEGGSGQVRFSIPASPSGGSCSPSGAYVAGASAGVDQLRGEDLGTGEVVRVDVTVDPAARLSLDPAELVLPLGHPFRLRSTGGSGELSLEPAPALVSYADGVLTGTAAGSRDLTVTDRFTGDTATLRLTVAAPRLITPRRSGNSGFLARAIGAGDLDGDGRPDAVLSAFDHDLEANAGGAVFVYRGVAGGLDATPARTLGGTTRAEELGRGLAVADLDGDGRAELIVGAPRADVSGADSGAVRIYRGVVGGFFEPAPSKVLSGRNGGDLFGSALGACDVNADGLTDLLIGARGAEDRGRTPLATDQGAVHVFLQRAGGFRDEPDQSLWGDLPEGDRFVGRAGLQLGFELAVGDLDGDGSCDVAASSIEYDRDPANNTNDGLVLVYRGARAGMTGRGGLGADPVLGWATTSTVDVGAQLGRALAIGELDQRPGAELVVLAPLADSGPGDNHGAVRIRAGAALPSEPIRALAALDAFDWSYTHDGDQDQLGYQAAIADVSGDGLPDLVVGAIRDEVMGGPDGAGTVVAWNGRAGQLPASSPSRALSGLAGGDAFGAALGSLGDLNGDASAELLVFATTADASGRDVGAPYLVDGRFDRPPSPLELPGVPSGVELGRGADLVGDLDGDGRADLVVGAPRDPSDALGINSGSGLLYRGTPAGFEVQPALVWREHPGHAGGDLFGQAVSRAGDFDGDGRPDVAIVARSDDRAASFPAADYAPEASCQGLGAGNDVGAVHVFAGAVGLPSTRPAFTIFGVEANDVIDGALGGFDHDGDGRDDLLLASATWDLSGTANTGGFAIVHGRPAVAGKIAVVCALDLALHPAEANTGMGRSLAALGDLDGDGCDELAIGSPTEDLGLQDQGAVRVLFGAGSRCAPGPRMVTLVGGVRGAQAGFSVGGGRDLDGDGVGDLVVGIPAHASGGDVVGAVRIVSGALILGAAREAPVDGVAPAARTPMTGPLFVGTTPGGRLGQSVAIDPRGLWVGAPLADRSGAVLSGGALRLSYDRARGFEVIGVFGGETRRELGRLGELVATYGDRALVAGYDGQGAGIDMGSAYAFPAP